MGSTASPAASTSSDFQRWLTSSLLEAQGNDSLLGAFLPTFPPGGRLRCGRGHGEGCGVMPKGCPGCPPPGSPRAAFLGLLKTHIAI